MAVYVRCAVAGQDSDASTPRRGPRAERSRLRARRTVAGGHRCRTAGVAEIGSLPKGVDRETLGETVKDAALTPLARCPQQGMPFVSLNTAFFAMAPLFSFGRGRSRRGADYLVVRYRRVR